MALRQLHLAIPLQPSRSKMRCKLRRSRLCCKAELDPEDLLKTLRETPRPKRTANIEPNFYLSREDAVKIQLKALQHNNFPFNDAGVEALYRFAGLDPFARSRYFGCSLDLGQYERFRRIFSTPYYVCLVNHTKHQMLSSLEVSEYTWKARVLVSKQQYKTNEERVYEFTMVQRLGGRFDGIWYTDSLICDGCDQSTLFGIM